MAILLNGNYSDERHTCVNSREGELTIKIVGDGELTAKIHLLLKLLEMIWLMKMNSKVVENLMLEAMTLTPSSEIFDASETVKLLLIVCIDLQ